KSLLYHKNKNIDRLSLRVIRENELEKVLYEIHSNAIARHFGVESIYNRRQEALQLYEGLYLLEIEASFDKIKIDIVEPFKDITENEKLLYHHSYRISNK
ncbi:19280_t:CDS:2, partial [Racocetra persica]